MPHLAWLTDLHLNFLSDKQAEAFCATVGNSNVKRIILEWL
jgi:hypothetical protein